MHDFFITLLSFVELVCVFCCVKAKNYHDIVRLNKNLLSNYSLDVRPIYNQSKAITVSCNFSFRLLKGFDDMDGVLTSSMLFEWEWRDEFMTWDPQDYGDIEVTKIPINKIWYPNVALTTPSEGFQVFDTNLRNFFIECDYTGLVRLRTGTFLKSICEANIKLYPFDQHTCTIELIAIGYNQHEVVFEAGNSKLKNIAPVENSIWVLNPQSVLISDIKGASSISVSMVLERRPSFLVVNLMTPVIFIMCINFFAFFIPASSGEKASFSITVFLTLAVFITIIMDKIPPISTEIPIVSKMMMFHLMHTALTCLICIASVHTCHRDGTPTGKFWRTLLVSSRYCQRNVTQIQPDESHSKNPNSADKDTNDKTTEMTWHDASLAIDRLGLMFTLIFTLIQLIAVIFFLIL